MRDVFDIPSGASVSVTPGGHVVVSSDETSRALRAIQAAKPGTLEAEIAWSRYWLEKERLCGNAMWCVADYGIPPIPIH